MELRHGTVELDILRERFLLTFNFKDGFHSIDEALQEIKAVIFRMSKELVDRTQPNWSTQLRHALECYNVTVEEEDDPQNITIPETEGQHEVEGSKVANLDISEPLRTQQVNIGSEE